MQFMKKLMLAIMISIQVFSITTMAQSTEEDTLIIVSKITGGIRYGLKGELDGEIKMNGNVAIQEGDYFELGFEDAKGQSVSELVKFDKLPKVKIVYKGKTLVEDEDFIITLREGKIQVHFNIEIKGQIQMTINSLQVGSHIRTTERAYYLVVEEHFADKCEKLEVQQVNINYGSCSNFGGRVAFIADSNYCEMDQIKYAMKGKVYVDDTTGQMMVPLKDVLKVLGTKEKDMEYSKGIFKAYMSGKYTFAVNSNKIEIAQIGEERKIESLQPVTIKDGNMYIALEDLANVLDAELEKGPETTILYVPVRVWIEN